MAISYSDHGSLAPYLAKYPGLFGFYGEGWVKDGAALGSNLGGTPLESIHDRCGADIGCELLPPIDLGEHDICFKDEEVEDMDSSENSADATPKALEADDWFIGDDFTANVNATIQRRDAFRINRRLEVLPGEATSPTSLANIHQKIDFSRLNALIHLIVTALGSCAVLTSLYEIPTTIDHARVADSARAYLHCLQPYCMARIQDLVLPEWQERFACSHQLFPQIRGGHHPLRRNPPSSRQPSAALEGSLNRILPFTSRLGLDERLILDLVAVLVAQCAANRISEQLRLYTHSYTRQSTSERSSTRGSSKAIMPSTLSLLQTSSKVGQGFEFITSSGHSPHDSVEEKALKFGYFADVLDSQTMVIVKAAGIKTHQFTIIRKRLEATGYLAAS